MHAYRTPPYGSRSAEGEGLSAAFLPCEAPRAGDLYFEAGLALIIPLMLALIAELCLAGA